jgi:hypothetical protein
VMPHMVRAERSLFTPSEASAILRISVSNILGQKDSITKYPRREKKLPTEHTEYTENGRLVICVWREIFCVFRVFRGLYSYLRATTGSRREAPQAGANPDTMPVMIDTIMLTSTRSGENSMGKFGALEWMPAKRP